MSFNCKSYSFCRKTSGKKSKKDKKKKKKKKAGSSSSEDSDSDSGSESESATDKALNKIWDKNPGRNPLYPQGFKTLISLS